MSNARRSLGWFRGLILVSVAVGWGYLPGAAWAVGFSVTPPTVKLEGNFAQAQLLVRANVPNKIPYTAAAEERLTDRTHRATYASSNPKIVTVDKNGRLLAQGNGQATITVQLAGEPSPQTVAVEVTGVEAQPRVSFAEDVVPILSHAGCNAAACHASQHGKGGFKLSVFGYAPDEDYAAIVRDRQGRRANLAEPDKSLVLLKPTLTIPHGGNRRLTTGSVAYQIIRAWLVAGAPGPQAGDRHVQTIRVVPPRRIATEGEQQQLRVEATYSDGRTRDVTAWAKFDSMDESVVTVAPDGLCHTVGRGQGAVMVRFEGQAEICQVVVPYADRVDLADWKNNNYVDELAAAKFRELGITPFAGVRRQHVPAPGLPRLASAPCRPSKRPRPFWPRPTTTNAAN